MIKELTTWIAAELGLTVDETLLAGWRPEDAADACTVILERTPAEVSTDGSEITRAPLSIVTRDASYHAARDAAAGLADLLINLSGVDIPGHSINSITGARPSYLGQDHRARHEFSTNITVRYRTKEA